MVHRGMVENNMKILELRQENLQLKKDLDAVEAQLQQLKIAQGEDCRPKRRRVCRSQKITAARAPPGPSLFVSPWRGPASSRPLVPSPRPWFPGRGKPPA